MITIKDNRIWFYSEDVDSELPTLDFKLISAYVCPSCNSILSAYFIGAITEKVIEFYWSNKSRKYQVGTIKGGSYLIQTNHGEQTYQGINCVYKARGRGISNCLKTLCGFGSLYNTNILNRFTKAIENGEAKELGFFVVNDMCQADASMLLYDKRICVDEKEEIVKLMQAFEDTSTRIERDELVEGSNPSEPKYTHLGKKKKIKIARNQTTLSDLHANIENLLYTHKQYTHT